MNNSRENGRPTWSEHVQLMLTDQEPEGKDGQIGVMWASSQGGCDPLKRLLKEVEGESRLICY